MQPGTMDYHLTTFLVLCIVSSAFGATTIFNVMNYGAVGNSGVDDSQAFLKAWNAACQAPATSSVPVVFIPKNNFYVKPLTFKGPCKSPRIYMLLSGYVLAPKKSEWGGKQKEAWIIFSGVIGLVLKGGGGLFDGRGSSWWSQTPCFHDPANGLDCKGPAGLIFRRCHGLRLDGFAKVDGPGSQIIIIATKDAVLSNITVVAPGNSPNTDGIDISASTRVHIRNSFVATGDDCIAITGGSSFIDVRGITCGPGHGISIGSLGGGGYDVVENVRVRNCTLKGTTTGVRIKTLQGGKGYARNISFEGIKFEAVDNPIQIEQFYCPLKVNCQNFTSAVAISDVSFNGISGTSIAENVIDLRCSQTIGCKNIKLNRVYITSSTPGKKVSAVCFNAHGTATRTKPTVKCLLP